MDIRHVWMLGITLASAPLMLTAEARAATPSWEEVPPMSAPRHHHTATLLQDGRVLVMGGEDSLPFVAEIYDPGTKTWASAAPPPEFSTDGPAVLLPNGHVFVVGSSGSAIYDPALDSWTPGALPFADLPSAVLLADGTVLVIGQDDLAFPTFIEGDIYDPESNRWHSIRPLPSESRELRATLLGDGRVLVMSDTANIYDPETDSWEPAAAPLSRHQSPSLTRLISGDILAAGGVWGSSALSPFSVEVYSAGDDAWVPARGTSTTVPCSYGGSRELGEGGMASSLLPSGRVLLTGGAAIFSCRPEGSGSAFYVKEFYSIAELYDPELATTSSISAAPPVTMARAYHTSTRLNDGSVLITGGAVGPDRGCCSFTPTAAAMLFHERSPLGAACELDSDCASGFCVDAVCSSSDGSDGSGGSGGGAAGTGGAGEGGSGGTPTGEGGSGGTPTGEGGSGGTATGEGGSGGTATGEGGSGGTPTGEGGSGGTPTGEGGSGGTPTGEGGSGGTPTGGGSAVVSGSGTGGLNTSSSTAGAGGDLPSGGGGCSAAPASQGAPAWLFFLGGLATTQLRRRKAKASGSR
ncbi:kelch repeat-containing protein [Sorangium sp. KYC3313]|uniref:Kelch repeat-containing protein n=1 Tax=Sorangium sp. KYC3313 TaxID=3449740 RepID=UPI003F8C63E5